LSDASLRVAALDEFHGKYAGHCEKVLPQSGIRRRDIYDTGGVQRYDKVDDDRKNEVEKSFPWNVLLTFANAGK